MCDGGVFSVPIAMAVIGAGTAIYQSKQTEKALNEQAKIEQDQIDNQAGQQEAERRAAARQERASARAAAAEAAVGGNSLAALEADIEAAAGRDITTIESNRKNGIHVSQSTINARKRVASAEAVSGVVSSAASGASSAYDNYKIQRGGK